MIEIKKNDIVLRDQNRWLYFSEPCKIICAVRLDEVIPALLEVESLVAANDWHAAGFLSYESASAFDAAFRIKPIAEFPYLWFGLYPEPRSFHLPSLTQPKPTINWQPTIDQDSYNAAIAKIKQYIADGETYQVNYTMRLQADFNISAWDFFLQLVQNQNNHAAYIDTGRHVICSASPELFFQLDGDKIICRPMKGTVRRGRTTKEDQQQADWLRNSEKNCAENVMIVDMIRNDLGRIAKTGSIQVTDLFCVERYPSLWQMTSTVTAQTHASLTDIFGALFPCASITGAPKVSTMEIINELETAPRKIYTGSIGYIFPKRKAMFNVAIRTVFLDRELGQAEYGVGGGIVWDSDSVDEHTEAMLKAKVLNDAQPEFSLLETILWTPEDGYHLYDQHLNRLLDSANYFDFSVSRKTLEKQLNETAATFSSPQRVRLLVDRAGTISVESALFQWQETSVRAHLAKQAIDANNVFLFHKTTQRNIYENARADFPVHDDVLLYNERDELTEFTIGNLVVELDGQLITPAIECGLLAGIFRARLLETGQIVEKVIPVQRLKDCARIFRVNSVRRWELVEMG